MSQSKTNEPMELQKVSTNTPKEIKDVLKLDPPPKGKFLKNPTIDIHRPDGGSSNRNNIFNVSSKMEQSNRFAKSVQDISDIEKSNKIQFSLPSTPKSFEQPPVIDFYYDVDENESDGRLRRPTIVELIDGSLTTIDDELEKFEDKNAKIIELQLKSSKSQQQQQQSTNHKSSINKSDEEASKNDENNQKKFGWIEGVFVRCCANIFGVILYLRMAWVAGQAGIIMGSAIVILGAIITLITTLSMSAICTNGLFKGGGAYYLISRSLGPKFGGAIGIIFSIANAVAVAMYIVGFSETVVQLLANYGIYLIDGNINDVRIIGIITCIILLIIIFIGPGFEAKMQVFLLGIITASVINFYIGGAIPPSDEKKLKGMTGFSSATFMENLYPAFREGFTFFSVFAIYFPAATGIMAGANISGDLKNSATAIPKGTLLAILITPFIYLSIIWISGATVIRDSDGFTFPIYLDNPTNITNDGWWISTIFSSIFGGGLQYYAKPECAFDNTEPCKYGIMNDQQIFNLIALWSPLVTAGVLTSTLSSALLSFVSAPKLFQAVAQDKLYPYIGPFSKGFNNSSEPQKAYLLTFVISCMVVLVGNLNAIAPIISNFYLSTYTLINLACFDTSFAKSPGFRPSFKFYNQWISLIGAILCICVMFVISWLNALLTFMFFSLLYFYMSHRKPDVNWGSNNQAHTYRYALQYTRKLENTIEHVKNYRPQILVLTGNPAFRPSLIDFAHAITKGNSLLICGHIIPYDLCGNVSYMIQKLSDLMKTWFIQRNLKAFYFPVASSDFRQGIQCLLQGSGLGKLRPNIVLMGFKRNWNFNGIYELNKINDYFNIIETSFHSQLAVCILRNGSDNFDYSKTMPENQLPFVPKTEKTVKKIEKQPWWKLKTKTQNHEAKIESQSNFSNDSGENDESKIGNNKKEIQKLLKDFDTNQIEIFATVNRFRLKINKGVIDVWWLYDDGGLTLLIPYLLNQKKSYLEGAKLRVFTLSTNSDVVEEEEKMLKELLKKFRINCDEIKVIQNGNEKPKEETMAAFHKLIYPFCVKSGGNNKFKKGMIEESELKENEEKTWKTLKIAEYLEEYSSKSDLIVVTLPVPQKNIVSSCLYMAWIDLMTKNLPPTLLIVFGFVIFLFVKINNKFLNLFFLMVLIACYFRRVSLHPETKITFRKVEPGESDRDRLTATTRTSNSKQRLPPAIETISAPVSILRHTQRSPPPNEMEIPPPPFVGRETRA